MALLPRTVPISCLHVTRNRVTLGVLQMLWSPVLTTWPLTRLDTLRLRCLLTVPVLWISVIGELNCLLPRVIGRFRLKSIAILLGLTLIFAC